MADVVSKLEGLVDNLIESGQPASPEFTDVRVQCIYAHVHFVHFVHVHVHVHIMSCTFYIHVHTLYCMYMYVEITKQQTCMSVISKLVT